MQVVMKVNAPRVRTLTVIFRSSVSVVTPMTPKLVPVVESLGPEYGEACILDLEVTWSESEPRTPLICILSIGSDPSPQITALAKAKEISKYSIMMVIFKFVIYQ